MVSRVIPETASYSSAPFLDNNALSVSTQLGGGTANPLLPSPASLQLAQLQAQLTLQRIKLAHTAVTSNSAAAATVLNQVLSKVAMSQPFFNPLRNAAMIGAHSHAGMNPLGSALSNARLPPSGLPFSTHNSPLAPNHAHNVNSMQAFGKGGNKPVGFFPGSQAFASDTDPSGYHGLMLGSSVTGAASDGHYGPKHDHLPGFKKDFYDSHGQYRPQKGPNNQWESPRMWQSPSSHYEGRNELYNPEEPTPDTKFSPSSSPTFVRHNNGKIPNSTMKNLQPHELNDFHGITPQHLPHICTMCDKKVFNLKDWELHIKGRMHIQNMMSFSETMGLHPVSADGPVSSEFDPVSNEAVSYLQPGLAFSASTVGAKNKSAIGRVVHICNIPEGSCNENDVINLGLPFGKVTNYILMKSTNQAFLEMAYTEAAEAMVQFYQEKPAMINDEKLLIRMSKRYKELQLKKPGKNVDAVIYDIHSQRERDMFRDTDRYRNERERSRSPVSRSLSPRSHTPSFTSCSSTHSPLSASRAEWANGREAWDQSAYGRREEEREQGTWRDSGEEKKDRTDHWVHDRKHYSWQLDKQELDDRMDGPRGHREKYGNSHSSSRYKSRDGEYYRKEAKTKIEGMLQDTAEKSKRKDESRTREARVSSDDTSKKEIRETSPSREAEGSKEKEANKKQTDSPNKQPEEESAAKENAFKEKDEQKDETMDHNSVSPKHAETSEEPQAPIKQKEDEWESGSEVEGEPWYPTNMEELVTVDEVGEEDLIIEPDITELEEIVPVLPKDNGSCIQMCSHGICSIDLECSSRLTNSACSSPHEASIAMSCTSIRESASPESSCCGPNIPDVSLHSEQKSEELEQHEAATSLHEKESLAESSSSPNNSTNVQSSTYKEDNNLVNCMDLCKRKDVRDDANEKMRDIHTQEESCEKRERVSGHSVSSEVKSAKIQESESKERQSSPSWEQEDVFSELSIPLGVEFVVPRTGFFCKLCGIFYTSEETAKTSHCRSRVHYRNLQNYLSRLAEGCSGKNETENMIYQEDVGLVPQFEKNRP
ncbi:RNA-binding protein 20 isoform X2 [Xenopus laevis]|uniref:RNA-binding protein 20 isoform X2 n=1 Tax=Xenopus laevis TaxID=8355 RepID=A0A8J0TA35_XENLA|nr:RNA-binding protein 20 isoform X2 [Xenopus laevis]